MLLVCSVCGAKSGCVKGTDHAQQVPEPFDNIDLLRADKDVDRTTSQQGSRGLTLLED